MNKELYTAIVKRISDDPDLLLAFAKGYSADNADATPIVSDTKQNPTKKVGVFSCDVNGESRYYPITSLSVSDSNAGLCYVVAIQENDGGFDDWVYDAVDDLEFNGYSVSYIDMTNNEIDNYISLVSSYIVLAERTCLEAIEKLNSDLGVLAPKNKDTTSLVSVILEKCAESMSIVDALSNIVKVGKGYTLKIDSSN